MTEHEHGVQEFDHTRPQQRPKKFPKRPTEGLKPHNDYDVLDGSQSIEDRLIPFEIDGGPFKEKLPETIQPQEQELSADERQAQEKNKALKVTNDKIIKLQLELYKMRARGENNQKNVLDLEARVDDLRVELRNAGTFTRKQLDLIFEGIEAELDRETVPLSNESNEGYFADAFEEPALPDAEESTKQTTLNVNETASAKPNEAEESYDDFFQNIGEASEDKTLTKLPINEGTVARGRLQRSAPERSRAGFGGVASMPETPRYSYERGNRYASLNEEEAVSSNYQEGSVEYSPKELPTLPDAKVTQWAREEFGIGDMENFFKKYVSLLSDPERKKDLLSVRAKEFMRTHDALDVVMLMENEAKQAQAPKGFFGRISQAFRGDSSGKRELQNLVDEFRGLVLEDVKPAVALTENPSPKARTRRSPRQSLRQQTPSVGIRGITR